MSSVPVAAFARERGINYKTLMGWRASFRSESPDAVAELLRRQSKGTAAATPMPAVKPEPTPAPAVASERAKAVADKLGNISRSHKAASLDSAGGINENLQASGCGDGAAFVECVLPESAAGSQRGRQGFSLEVELRDGTVLRGGEPLALVELTRALRC